MIERRLEGRFLCADLVKAEWLSDAGAVTLEAVLEDISALGACVQVDESIPAGASISIVIERARNSAEPIHLSGLVSYCVYRDYGYFVGIRFSSENRWSSGLFAPEHLMDLESLVPPHGKN
jgi:hypothetical protein